MDAISKLDRLEMEVRFNRDLDLLRGDIKDRALNKDVATLAQALSDSRLDQAEKNRAIKDGVADLEKAVRSLAQIVSANTDGSPLPASRWSLSKLDPKVLLTVGLAGGAAAGKAIEYLTGLVP